MADAKNNAATRFCREIISGIESEIVKINEARDIVLSEAKSLSGQRRILEQQIIVISESLAQGNYEKNGKEGD